MRGMAQCGVHAEAHLDSEEASQSDVLREDKGHRAGAISRKALKARLNAENLDVDNPDQSCRWPKVLFRKVTSENDAGDKLVRAGQSPLCFCVKPLPRPLLGLLSGSIIAEF